MATQFAMRFLSSATSSAASTPATPTPPPKPPVPAPVPAKPSPPAPKTPVSRTRPLPGPSPLSRSEPRRVSEVLPGVICKLCSQSVPMDQLGEHDCEKRPPMPIPAAAQSGGPGPAPTRRPSDPPRTKSPSPTRPAVPSSSAAAVAARDGMRPSMDAGRPSIPSPKKLDPEPSTAPVPPPPAPTQAPLPRRTPPPEQQPQRRPSRTPPPSSVRSQQPAPPPSIPPPPPPANRGPSPGPSATNRIPIPPPPQHSQSHPVLQQQQQPSSPPERIQSPDVGRPVKRSNSETPYFIDQSTNDNNTNVTEAPTLPPISPDPATNMLSTYGVPIPDTKVGGEAGMAGVGRRGFAAVAQAAMFVQGGAGSPMTPYGFGPNRTPSPGFFMGGQRTGSPGVMMPPFAGGPPPGGVPGPYPPGAYGPGSGPPGPARLGSPNMPPYGAQRPGPGPGQYVGQDPRAANGNGLSPPPSGDRTPSPRLPEAGPSGTQNALHPTSAERRPSEDRLTPLNTNTTTRGRESQSPNSASASPNSSMPTSGTTSLQRSNTETSRYTEDSSPVLPIQHRRRRSPSPMTREEQEKSPRDSSVRHSDASSSYTTLSLSGPARQLVSNIKPSVRNLFRKASSASQNSNASESIASPVSSSSSGSIKLPFFEKLKAQAAAKRAGSQSSSGSSGSGTETIGLVKSSSLRSDTSSARPARLEKALPPVKERRESISSDDSMSDTELAYANFDDPPAPPVIPPVPTTAPLALRRRASREAAASSAPSGGNTIPFPSPIEQEHKKADSTSSGSSSSISSFNHKNPKAPSGEEKPTIGVQIFDDASAPQEGASGSAGTRGLLGASGDGLSLPESPMSSPSPTMSTFSSGGKKKKKQVRQCRQCLKLIHDGKWVAVDVGTPEAGVMCEYDWKENYLPKCRRCELPIEGPVISSTDGSILGKYHRKCFTCIICDKSFPDKTFYVYDGVPHCDYHYAEANGSLCASSTCGQPVEGACALSDDGKRFHPEHFVCDWNGGTTGQPTRRGKCKQQLEDYWEVGPLKYCSERHAMWAQEAIFAAEAQAKKEGRISESTASNARATKRRTMFIEQTVDRVAL